MTLVQQSLLNHCDLADQLRNVESEDELLSAVLRLVVQLTSVDWAGIYLIDERIKSIVLNPRYSWIKERTAKGSSGGRGLEIREVGWKNGVVGRVARNKQGWILGDEKGALPPDLLFDFGVANGAIALPLIAEGRTVAVLAAGKLREGMAPEDVTCLRLLSGVAAAHWIRQVAARERGASGKALQRLIQGIGETGRLLRSFRETYRLGDFLPSLSRVPLALIKAEGCLILTYNASTDGLWPEGCYCWDRGGEHSVQASDHVYVDLIRHLRGRRRIFVEADLSEERAGPFGKLDLTDPFLSALVVPTELFSGRESYLLLLSWSRNGFGTLEQSIATLLQQLLEVLAVAHDTQATVDYIQRTAVMAHQIAGTTHELRNFVTYATNDIDHIQQILMELASQPPPDDWAQRLLNLAMEAADARVSCDKARHRVEILRHFRQKGQVQLSVKAFDLNALLDEVRKINQDHAQSKDIQIEADYDATEPEIESDPILISECVGNLLLNAVYFTGRKRRIVLGSRYYRDDALPIWIWVYDEGGGIHTSEVQKIFEPFYSTKKASDSPDDHSGSGLGLFLTRNNLTLLGGKITVESVVPNWTRFTIKLPLKYSERKASDEQVVAHV